MAEDLRPDFCIVGGGPGGITAALAAADGGATVVLIEKAAMGGADLAYGSVPAQALISAASVNESLTRGPAMGVSGAPHNVDFAKVREHVKAVSASIAARVSAERLAAFGVRVITATARFSDPDTLAAGDVILRPRFTILAVGSVPARPDLPGLDTVEAMTPADAFDLGRKSGNVIVLGATPVGLELAQAYRRLGIDASVVDPGSALPDHDPELSTLVVERLRAEGMRVRTDVRIGSIAKRRGGVRVTVAADGGDTAVDGAHLLVATGRTPAIGSLGLDNAGIDHDKDGIVVDRALRTSNRRVWAIGDAIAGPARAVRAEYEAREVIRSILSRRPLRYDATLVPRVVYTDPPLASVGLSEAEARRTRRTIRVMRYPFVENDLAQAERRTEGLVKVIATRSGRILGAGIVGRGAGELIAVWSLALANRLPLDAMRNFAVPYPARTDVSRKVAGPGSGPNLTHSWPRRIIAAFTKPG